MDPRLAILVVLSTAFAEGIPEIEKRVGLLRVEPVWGDEELPIILIDFDGERREIRTVAPRDYAHVLTVNVIIYVKGDSEKNRVALLGLLDSVERTMRERQFITAGDLYPDCAEPEVSLVDDIRAGNNVSYFVSPNGNEEHMAVRVNYEAEFYTSGASAGVERRGVPGRNILREFESMLVNWLPRRKPGANAVDLYNVKAGGENHEP